MITINSSLEEISQAIADKQNEKMEIIKSKGVIAQKLYLNAKERMELTETKRKAQETLELIKTDLSLLKDMFWQKKEE